MQAQHLPNRRLPVGFAWGLMLLASDFPNILWYEFTGSIPGWLPWAKVGAAVVGLGMCWLWRSLRASRPYAGVFLAFSLSLVASNWVDAQPWWQSRFAGAQVSFTMLYLGGFIRDLGVAAVVIVVLWFIYRKRSAFFFVKGRLDASIAPVRWLGIGAGESWRVFGWIFTAGAVLGVAIPTFLGMRLAPGTLLRALPLLPSVLLFSAINAFTEETYFRAGFLSTLHTVVGKNHALLITSLFFGLSHYFYGSPPGVFGVLLTSFLAWLLGKAMLETQGFAWPWFMHFVPDVVVFVSYALNWVQ
ncbi:MAG: CPBP family intramembrane metalloprotease [Anaerolineae bacterium]|nr:CPBP family intramembrane metalloprotease [Anaerolineae bacterium]